MWILCSWFRLHISTILQVWSNLFIILTKKSYQLLCLKFIFICRQATCWRPPETGMTGLWPWTRSTISLTARLLPLILSFNIKLTNTSRFAPANVSRLPQASPQPYSIQHFCISVFAILQLHRISKVSFLFLLHRLPQVSLSYRVTLQMNVIMKDFQKFYERYCSWTFLCM